MCAYMPRSRGIFLRKMPPSAGIYVHICPGMYIYKPRIRGYIQQYSPQMRKFVFFMGPIIGVLWSKKPALHIHPKKGYNIYIYRIIHT